MRASVIERILSSRLVAILRLPDLHQAEAISLALLAGGVRVIEFTLTNPEAASVVGELKRRIPHFSDGRAALGLGSVRSLDEAERAIEVGADFAVSPITDPAIIARCREAGLVSIPGALTPTEIHVAWQAGADIVKVFPAAGLGPGYITSVLGPMPYLRLMPTGGIGIDQIPDFLRSGAVAVGVGGPLSDSQRIAAGDWHGLTQVAAQAAQAAESWQ
jgi:2-dehydro-3-deoxyphosphogluconate aldolase/(4S)-4-hydroxy-2-oxoglutarate aldolase